MDERMQDLISDFRQGYLTRRGFLAKAAKLGLSAAAALALVGSGGARAAQATPPVVQARGWRRGRGWGWVWGPNDELGNLNELSPELTLKALSFARTGRVYDLGLTYDRHSYRWPGHSPGEILTFRSQQGEWLQRDVPLQFNPAENTSRTSFASSALFMSDNAATQCDGFGHVSLGEDPYYYNGYRAAEVVGDWGLLKMGADTIPPIVAPATLIDVAGHLGIQALSSGFAVGPALLQDALAGQGVDIDPLDVVLIRTGTGGVWLRGDGVGANREDVRGPDSSGINLAAARWLVEEKGALAIGADTSGLEVSPPVDYTEDGTSFNPVHVYLIPKQGVHILELHNLEEVAAERAYKFAYCLGVNRIKGTAVGTALRPFGIA